MLSHSEDTSELLRQMEELEMLRVRTKLLEILTNIWAMVVTADADVVVRDIVTT